MRHIGRLPGMRGRRVAFTLIELLVVIAVIAILAALALPVMLQAQRHAIVSSCSSNLRQIAAGLYTYGQSYSMFLPSRKAKTVVSDDDLEPLFPAFVGDIKTFRCPASQYDQPTKGEHINYKTSLQGTYGDRAQLSYEYPGECLLSLSRKIDTRFALFAYDDDGRGTNVRTDVDAHSPAGGNMSFADGRVEWVKANDWYYAVWDGIYAWYNPPKRFPRPTP